MLLLLISYSAMASSSLPGQRVTHHVEGVVFSMRLAPSSVFPKGIDDSKEGVVELDFWIAETPVTYELWRTIRVWAEENGYIFANQGQGGSHGQAGESLLKRKNHPVTKINWRDSIIWCNALSEYKGLSPVYRFNGEIIRDSTFKNSIACDNAVQEKVDGFRLPTSNEWELAARYRGSDSSPFAIEMPLQSGQFWTPGTYASGAVADYHDEEATGAVAWYQLNSYVEGHGLRTHAVGQKESNLLGLYDMSGNVWEWCFDWDPKYIESNRVRRGGAWFNLAYYLLVGNVYSVNPVNANSSFGFRLARTYYN